MNDKQGGLPSTQAPTTGLESLQRAPSSTGNTASVSGVSTGSATTIAATSNANTTTNSRSRFSASFAGYSPATTPGRSSTPGVVRQPSGQSANSFKAPKRPMHPWKKQALLLSSVVLFVSLLSVAALRLNHRIQKSAANKDVATSFKPIANPVLGEDSLIPVQSLNDKTVTINGDLTVTGKLNLSAQAITDLAGLVGNKVALSPTLGGPTQAGNILLSGSVLASNFQGNGANLSNLNASSITTGTLDSARLDPSVTRLGQTIPLSVLQSTVVSSLNGLGGSSAATGAVQLVGSGPLTVTTNPLTNQIVIGTTGGGDITGVIAGSGLTGGGLSGDVTLNVDTGIVTVQGNVFNGANQLVQLNGAGELPVISAINLTNLNASNLGTGTVADSRLSSNVTLQGNTFNLPNKLVQLDNSGNLPAVDGSALTNLNANNIGTGTLSDSRLSANVALLGANQTFTGNVVFSQPLSVNIIQPSSTMTIGATNQSLTLQGDMTTRLRAYSGANNVSLGFSGTPTGTVIYNLDAATPAGSYTLCTSVGNCASAGGGVTTLGGTTNQLVRFTGTQSIGDSSISDNGTLVTVAANGLFKASANSTTAFRVQNAAGSSNVFTVDTTNSRVAIGQATAGYTLDVAGDINSTTGLRVAGNLVCDATGCAASNGSGFYIQNSTTTQTAANFNIESTSNTTPTAVLKLKVGQSADLLQARDATNSVIAKIDANGNISTTGQYQVNGIQISSANLSNDANLAKLNTAQTFTAANLFQNASNSTTAFRIQNAAASNLFVADTTNSRIAIGQATAGYTLDVNGDINITTGNSYRINGVAICGPTATCAPSSGSTSYVQNGLTTQTANLNIQSSSSSAITAIVQGATGQTADLLQARDSNNNVVAKITSSGAIYQGTNQVCDTSNNCNYAAGSGSGNYIQNGTTTQTANMNIQSTSASQVTAVIQGTNAQTANILEIKDGTAQANTLFSVNQNTYNLIANPSFEGGVGGWTTTGSASIASTSAYSLYEANSAVITTPTNNDSIRYIYPLAPSTNYSFTFYMFAAISSGTTIRGQYSNDGSTMLDCGSFMSVVSVHNKWTRYICTFTTGSSISPGAFVGFKATTGTGAAYYIDGAQLETGITRAFKQGSIKLNGVIANPIAFSNDTNSTTAFQIQNAGGGLLLNADTANNLISLGGDMSYGTSFQGADILLANNGQNFGGKISARINNTNLLSTINTGWTIQTSQGNSLAPERAFEIINQNSNQLMAFDTTTGTANPNLLTNPSFDASQTTTGWSPQTSATISRITTDQYSGLGSLSVATAASASSGVRYNYNLLAATTYSFSVYAKATGSNFSTLELGYSADGSTQTSCVTAQTVTTTGWNRYTCTFTATSVSGTRFVYVKQTDATARTFYIDAAQLEVSSSASAYRLANIALNGTISSPAVFQNQSNSSTAFQVQNAAGTTLLGVDTTNSLIRLGTGMGSGNYSLFVTDAARLQNVVVGGTDGASTLRGATGSGGTINLQNSAAQSFSFNSHSNTTASNVFQFNATPNSTAENLLQVQRNGTAVATIGNSGSWLLRNTTDSNTAFQIQNSIGASVLNVNTAVNATTWNTTSAFASARTRAQSVVYNGKMYVLGGQNGSTGYNDVQYANINGDGTIGAWASTTIMPTGRSGFFAFANNGYMYIVGGSNGNGTYYSDVQYAPINGNGTLGAWSSTSSISAARQSISGGVYNGYVYITGGYNGSFSAVTEYAPINGNGTLGAWQTATSLPFARSDGSTHAFNGYLYYLGGSNGGALNHVNYAPINGNGTLGAWQTATSLPSARKTQASSISNGKIYLFGGLDSPNNSLTDVIGATINGDGTLGTWNSSTSLPAVRSYATGVAHNGYVYVLGGNNDWRDWFGTAYNTVYYAAMQAQAYSNVLSFDGLFSNTGPASFQNGTDSTNAFRVQNALAATIFQVDTTNSRVGIGNASPGNLLSVGALTTADADGVFAVSTGAVGKKGVVIQSVAGQTADFLQAQDSTGAVLAKIDASGHLTVKNAAVQGTLTVTDSATFNGNFITFSNNVRGYNVSVTAAATSQTVSFLAAHPDANYSVFCTPNWSTTCYVSNKTTSGFTLNYGTAAPAAQLVDWFVAR